MAEAVMVLPVIALLWLGFLYVHQLARHVAAASAAARSRAWAHAFDGCRGDDVGAAGDCADAIALEMDRTGQGAVDDAMGDLFGGWARRDARTRMPRPAWLGGQDVHVAARACVPCNPVPKESLEVIRRTYDDSRASVRE